MIFQKLNKEFPYDSVILLLDMHPKEMETETQTDICIPVFTVALFIIAKWQKHPKCPSIDEWVKKNIVHITYYSALTGKEILTHAKLWTDLEDTVLCDVSQLQKDNYCMALLMCSSQSS